MSCVTQANAHAPVAGTATYSALASQYASSACRAYAVDITYSNSVHVTASLPNNAITQAQCPSVVADLKVAAFNADAIDCSDIPNCKPHLTLSETILAEAKVNGVWSGGRCTLPTTAVLNDTFGANAADYVKLLATATLNGTDENLTLSVTTH